MVKISREETGGLCRTRTVNIGDEGFGPTSPLPRKTDKISRSLVPYTNLAAQAFSGLHSIQPWVSINRPSKSVSRPFRENLPTCSDSEESFWEMDSAISCNQSEPWRTKCCSSAKSLPLERSAPDKRQSVKVGGIVCLNKTLLAITTSTRDNCHSRKTTGMSIDLPSRVISSEIFEPCPTKQKRLKHRRVNKGEDLFHRRDRSAMQVKLRRTPERLRVHKNGPTNE